jgi:hypothetical protein
MSGARAGIRLGETLQARAARFWVRDLLWQVYGLPGGPEVLPRFTRPMVPVQMDSTAVALAPGRRPGGMLKGNPLNGHGSPLN